MYEQGKYKDMMLALSNLNAEGFVALKNENMTLLHHASFDQNYEAVKLMSTLPYFKDIIDDASNQVRTFATKSNLQLARIHSFNVGCV